ncbi:MAG: DUF58 domain-containing protein [Armatimonadetes bacterium]|nr:DUF58 domain-containing protein [Armatimonadota bacterium]
MEQILTTENQTDREDLLTPEFLRKVEQLSIVAKRVFPGQMRGERRSTKRGASVEFADYRNYAVGDDFRRVDWNVYARLEKLFMKLFVEEEDLHVYILLDTSRSMNFGSPRKLLYAKRIAAALSYIALANLDRVGLASLSGSSAMTLSQKRGKQSAFSVFEWLKSVQCSGDTHLADSLRDFSLRTRQPGVVMVISDFFDTDYQKGISALLSRNFEVTLLHVLDQEEVEPSTVGDLLLIDSETAERREITITQTLLKKYKARVAEFCGGIESFATRCGCNYVRVTNQSSFEDLILSYLRQRGMLK